MLTLALNEIEAQVMREVLQSYRNTLMMELSKADRMRFKEMLRARESVVSDVLSRFQEVPAQ
jgi:hypothetical protein